jgi:hypothetical protein
VVVFRGDCPIDLFVLMDLGAICIKVSITMEDWKSSDFRCMLGPVNGTPENYWDSISDYAVVGLIISRRSLFYAYQISKGFGQLTPVAFLRHARL